MYIIYLVGGIASLQLPGVPFEAFVAALPLSAVVIWRLVARRPFAEVGLGRVVSWWWHLGLPLIAAIGYASFTLAASHFLGIHETTDVRPSAGMLILAVAALGPLVALLATAIPEEFVFRGFYLRLFEERAGFVAAAALSSFLFAIAHLPALLDDGTAAAHVALRLTSHTGFGLIMVWAVVRTGSLWVAIAWHGGINYPGVVAQFTVGGQMVPGMMTELADLAFLAGQAVVVAVLVGRIRRTTESRVVP